MKVLMAVAAWAPQLWQDVFVMLEVLKSVRRVLIQQDSQ